MRAYPAHSTADEAHIGGDGAGVLVPLRLQTDAGLLSFISTTTVFGTATEITLSEIALETFLPADAETAARLRAMFG